MAKPQDVKVVLEEHYREGKSYPYLLIDGRRIYFTYGIEFEMIITNPHYYDDDEDSGDDKIQEVNYLSQYGSVGEDRSVTCDSGVPIEFKTRKMSKNREQLSQWLQQVFNSEYRLVRGGTFNSSTGMHIHIKTSYPPVYQCQYTQDEKHGETRLCRYQRKAKLSCANQAHG